MLQIRLLLIDNLKESWKKYDICYLTVRQFTEQDHALWAKQNFMPVKLFANVRSKVTVSSAQLDAQ